MVDLVLAKELAAKVPMNEGYKESSTVELDISLEAFWVNFMADNSK